MTNPIVTFLNKVCKLNPFAWYFNYLVYFGLRNGHRCYLSLTYLINQLSSLIISSQTIYSRVQDLIIDLSNYPALQNLDVEATIQQLNLSYVDILQIS